MGHEYRGVVEHIDYNGDEFHLEENKSSGFKSGLEMADNTKYPNSEELKQSRVELEDNKKGKKQEIKQDTTKKTTELKTDIEEESQTKENKEVIEEKEDLEWTKSLDGLEEFYNQYGELVKELSQNLGFPEEYILSILSIESIFDVNARSDKYSTGAMQLTSSVFNDAVKHQVKDKNGNLIWVGRGRIFYLPVIKSLSSNVLDFLKPEGNDVLITQLQGFSTDLENKGKYAQIIQTIKEKVKYKKLFKDNPKLNIVMGAIYMKVVRDTLNLENMYRQFERYKPFLEIKLSRVNGVLKERGCVEITKEDLEEFKNKIKNKQLTKQELELLLTSRQYNGDTRKDEGDIQHRVYYATFVYFINKHLVKQKNNK